MNQYYLAYGSNLNMAQMERRCPTATVFGVSRIQDYRLCFKGAGFATIEPFEGGSVPVVVWKLKPKDERALDTYEGFPTHYFKRVMTVNVSGVDIRAMVYIMRLDVGYARPSHSYFNAVLSGYRTFGLSEDKLFKALDAHSQDCNESNRLRWYRRNCGMTQRELAELANLDVKRISKYESGERDISKAQAEAVIAIAEALSVEPRQLLK